MTEEETVGQGETNDVCSDIFPVLTVVYCLVSSSCVCTFYKSREVKMGGADFMRG